MTVEYLDLADFLVIAEEITGIEVPVLMKMSRLSLADSALHAPQAGYGDVDLYPDFVDKAAVLLVRLAINHPLPDGNKRAAWVSMRMFVAINDWSWDPHPRRRGGRRGQDSGHARELRPDPLPRRPQ